MATVNIRLRTDSPALDDQGNPTIKHSDGSPVMVEAPYEDVELDDLSPRARALAEAVAQAPLRTLTDIWVESDSLIRDRYADWEQWYPEEQANTPERRSWRGWSYYPATSRVSPVEYLERQADKFPPGWHVLGHRPDTPVPSHAEAGLMTRDQVLRYLREKGRDIRPSTWSGYVARGQAPKPARHIGRTPVWDSADIAKYADR